MTAPGTRDPDALRHRAGVVGDPDRDQHFLVDDRVLDRLPGYLPDDAELEHVLEIGAGTGALTDRLLAVADRVTVIERDRQLTAFLREEFAEHIATDELTIITGDVLDVDLPRFTASVSNLPYGIASQILFRLLPVRRPLVVTVQREFADRLVASAGTSAYGRLSVTAGHFAGIEEVEPVPAEAFDPQPAVESAVIRTQPRARTESLSWTARGPSAADGESGGGAMAELDPREAFFLQFVRAVFTQRRKTVRNAIRNTDHISGLETPQAVVEAADDDLMAKRPDQVTRDEFSALACLAWERGDPG